MNVESLTEDEKDLLISIINRLSSQTPCATKVNLKYFADDYIEKLVLKAYQRLNLDGQHLARSILEKIAF